MFRPDSLEIARGIAYEHGYTLKARDGEFVLRHREEPRPRICHSLADAIATMVHETTGISREVALASYEDL